MNGTFSQDTVSFENIPHYSDGLRHFSFVLDRLEYAATTYNVSIMARILPIVNISNGEDSSMWSDAQYTVFRTSDRAPKDAPETEVGAFCVDGESHKVYLYWEPLPPSKHSGENVRYVVAEVSRPSLHINYTWPMNLATYDDPTDESLEFSFRSENDEGISESESFLHVPSMSRRCSKPFGLKLIRSENELYDLWWQSAPSDACPQIQSFSIFWCELTQIGLPGGCNGSVSFQRIYFDVDHFQLKSSEKLNFAISANTNATSSGMEWAECVADANTRLGKLTTIQIVRIEATLIEYKWQLNCLERTLVSDYVLRSCTIDDKVVNRCQSNGKIFITPDQTGFNMSNLLPFTTYRIEISVWSANSHGQWSDEIVAKTLEGQPSPPEFLQFTKVTNNTATLEWNVPNRMNGLFQMYKVIGAEKEHEVRDTAADKVEYILDDLHSFTEYSVHVVACSRVGCSNASNAVQFVTKVGVANEILHTTWLDDRLVLFWNRSHRQAGFVSSYELKFLKSTTENSAPIRIGQIKGKKCTPIIDVCGDYVSIRTIYAAAPATDDKIVHESDDSFIYKNICLEVEQRNQTFEKYTSKIHMISLWTKPIRIQCKIESSHGGISFIVIAFVLVLTLALCVVAKVLRRFQIIQSKVPTQLQLSEGVNESISTATEQVESDQLEGETESDILSQIGLLQSGSVAAESTRESIVPENGTLEVVDLNERKKAIASKPLNEFGYTPWPIKRRTMSTGSLPEAVILNSDIPLAMNADQLATPKLSAADTHNAMAFGYTPWSSIVAKSKSPK